MHRTNEDGVHMNTILKNLMVKQENDAIKLQYAMEKVDSLNDRLESIMGNRSDLKHYIDESKAEKELTREKIRECNEKSLKL